MAKKNFKKRYSNKERAAYWAGVGIAAARYKEDDLIMNNSQKKIQKSAIAGYKAVSDKDITNTVFGSGDTRKYINFRELKD